MDAYALFPFLLLSLTVELTPGPNMAYLAVISIAQGRRAGLFAVAGIALGLMLIGTLAALGVATIVSSSPLLTRLLVGAGILYLLWLAWDCWKGGLEVSPDRAEFVYRRYFVRGLMTNLLNPKAFLFYIMVLPSFVEGREHLVTNALLLTLISVAIATSVHLCIVMLGSRLRPYTNHPRRRQQVRRVMALLLVAIAGWLMMSNASLVF